MRFPCSPESSCYSVCHIVNDNYNIQCFLQLALSLLLLMHPPLPERISPHFCLGCSASVAPRVSLHQSQSASFPACRSFSEKREVVSSFHQPYKDILRKVTVSLLLLSSFSVLLLWKSPIVKKHLSFIAIFFLLACELLKVGLNSPFPLHLNIFIPQLHLAS